VVVVSHAAFAFQPVEPQPAQSAEPVEPGERTEGAERAEGAESKQTRSRTPARRSPGVTGRGACVLIAVATFIGGLLDLAISGHRGHLFGVLFAIASALGALAVRKKDLRVAMVAPPMLYCVLIFVMSLIDQGGLTGGLLTREAFYLGNAFVTGAPAMWVGSLLAAAIGWYRLRAAGGRLLG
jgi:hypothetical protein